MNKKDTVITDVNTLIKRPKHFSDENTVGIFSP